jgi:hypothetical protein
VVQLDLDEKNNEIFVNLEGPFPWITMPFNVGDD